MKRNNKTKAPGKNSNERKRRSNKIFVSICAFISILMLCSFVNSNTENTYFENKALQKSAKSEKSKETNGEEPTDELFGNDDIYGIDGELKKIYDEFIAILPTDVPYDIDSITGSIGISEVLEFIKNSLSESNAGKTFLLLFGIGILFCLAEILSSDMPDMADLVKAAVCVCLTLPVLSLMSGTLMTVRDGLISGSDFFSKVIPVMSGVLAIGGGGTAALVSGATMNLSLSFVSGLLSENLISIGILIFSLSLVSSFDTGNGTAKLSHSIRGWFNFFIGISSLVLVATLACQSVIAGARDSLILRGAKYAVSGMIPIVGGTVSGALSTLVSGIRLLSGSIGALSVIVILSVMGGPLVTLLFYRLCIGACITLTSFTGASFGEKFFVALRGALDTVIAVLASGILVYVLESVVFMRSVQGLL